VEKAEENPHEEDRGIGFRSGGAGAFRGLDLRGQWMNFTAHPPKLKADVSSENCGSSMWLGLGARFTDQW